MICMENYGGDTVSSEVIDGSVAKGEPNYGLALKMRHLQLLSSLIGILHATAKVGIAIGNVPWQFKNLWIKQGYYTLFRETVQKNVLKMSYK